MKLKKTDTVQFLSSVNKDQTPEAHLSPIRINKPKVIQQAMWKNNYKKKKNKNEKFWLFMSTSQYIF